MNINVTCITKDDKVAIDGCFDIDGDDWEECLKNLALEEIPKTTVKIEIDFVDDE